ncbi:endopeptidase La [Lottiidibacillus patelloidae]
MVIHLDVGRDKSVRAIENVMLGDKEIMLATQKDVSTNDPNEDDIYEVGTLAKVKQLLKLPNGTIRVLVEGIQRARILTFNNKEEFIEVEYELIEDELSSAEEASEEKALMRAVINQFEQYIKLSKKVSPETLATVVDLDDASHLADAISSHLSLKIKGKQQLLEETSVKNRLNLLLQILQDEREVLGIEKKIEVRVKRSMEKTQKEYYLREQMKAIQKELGDKDGKSGEVNSLRKQIEKANMPENILKIALKEVDRYEKVPASSAESSVIRNYLDWLIQLPWTKETVDNLNLNNAEKVLNADHYGLEKVKERILEYLAVKKLTNSIKGPILCLAGPPGVGKTSLARSIANSIDRKFVRISLGGVRDEAEIRGHRRTYVGAMPGRIIQGMKKAGTINPVFLLDEIDKMSNDFRGDPSSAMLEVLDPEQNNTFSDHYIEESYDLSNVMFIATANDISSIPGPLLDRMELIHIAGYTEVEKLHIGKEHLFPKQLKENGLDKGKVQLRDDALTEVIRRYTREAGVRNLEREIAKLCRKAAKMIATDEKKRVIITEKSVEEMIGKPKYRFGQAETEHQVGAATGLAYTSAGGDTLSIEVSVYPGKGKLILTGKLGDVMKESAQAAFSYIRSRSDELHVDPDFHEKNDIHIHVPEGAVPKDGPSAGITMATALVSALTKKPVNKEVGMTGEITLRGRVLPIGGLKEKTLSAHRAGLTTIIMPKENEKDLDDIPESVKGDITFIPVSHLDEVLQHAIVGE